MSCCISSAICCVLITASMSGVALGYNYSLAEYIDLKETNVSVYLKRGVFDDEISEGPDWRRGGQSRKGHLRDDGDLLTAAPEDEVNRAVQSGRRLDDTILESDDQHKFEGSLMRLTAKAPFPSTTTAGVTSDKEMLKIDQMYEKGSIDQLKAIQSLINMRKSAAARDPTKVPEQSTYAYDERFLPNFPVFPSGTGNRRMMELASSQGVASVDENLNNALTGRGPGNKIVLSPARLAVPDSAIGHPSNWMPRNHPQEGYRRRMQDYDERVGYPSPITPAIGPIRLTRIEVGTESHMTEPSTLQTIFRKEPKAQIPEIGKLDQFKEKLLVDKFESFGGRRGNIKDPKKTDFDYYEDDMKGLPVRRRRSIDSNKMEVDLLSNKIVTDKAVNRKKKPPFLKQIKLKTVNSDIIPYFPSILLSKLHISKDDVSKNLNSTEHGNEKNEGRENILQVTPSTDNIVKLIMSMFS